MLIVFTRYPVAGQAKTRLIPALGAAGAAALQRRMTQHTLALAQTCDRPLQIRFCGGSLAAMQSWLGADLDYQPQGDGDLGQRMCNALRDGFAQGGEPIVIIGTDCPLLDRQIIDSAFAALVAHDLVLGPAADGGYYLIGLRKLVPELFQSIAWSTATVLTQTLVIAQSLAISYALLPELSDIDRPEDLALLPAPLK